MILDIKIFYRTVYRQETKLVPVIQIPSPVLIRRSVFTKTGCVMEKNTVVMEVMKLRRCVMV